MYQANQKTNEYAKSLLMDKSTMSYFEEMKQMAKSNSTSLFRKATRHYISRLGVIIAKCNHYILKNNTYHSSIEYMCFKVIHNKKLYNDLQVFEDDDKAYAQMMFTNSIQVELSMYISRYNDLIDSLIEATNLTILRNYTLSEDYVMESNIHDLTSYLMISDVKFQIINSASYIYDPYTKTYNHTMTIYWPKPHTGYALKVSVSSAQNNRILTSSSFINLSNNSSKKKITIPLKDDDYDKDQFDLLSLGPLHKIIKLNVTITLFKEMQNTSIFNMFIKKKNTKYNEIKSENLYIKHSISYEVWQHYLKKSMENN